MLTRRNLLILGIGLIAAANIIVFVLGNRLINYSYSNTTGSFSLGIFAIPFGLVGFFLLMWEIFGRDFWGFPKADNIEDTQQN